MSLFFWHVLCFLNLRNTQQCTNLSRIHAYEKFLHCAQQLEAIKSLTQSRHCNWQQIMSHICEQLQILKKVINSETIQAFKGFRTVKSKAHLNHYK
jgi:hypothetical protein